MSESVLIIAEAGVNHNGDEALAYQLVDAAVEAGVDIVKFQTFKTDNLVTQQAKQAAYQQKNTQKEQSQYQLLKSLELSFDAHKVIKEYCEQKGIEYLSTAFDHESLQFLVEDMQLKRLKIPSGDLTNSPFVLAHAQTGCELIVSTGMATTEEINFALSVIAFGLMQLTEQPSERAFARAYQSEQGQKLLQQKVTLLHCTTEYPAPLCEVNLNAMETMATDFKLPVGYSDHTQGVVIPVAATAKGAKVIEKHFTLDRNMPGPDHQASIEPDELKQMVSEIRMVEKALGDGVKKPSSSEFANREIARKSIIAKCDIAKGELLTPENITIKRPGNGLSPEQYWQLLNTKAISDFSSGQLIEI